MVKPIRLIRIMFFLLLAACGTLCPSERFSADLLQGGGPDSHEVQRQQLHTWKSLPDAPSAQPLTQAEKFRTFQDEARSPLTFGAAGPTRQPRQIISNPQIKTGATGCGKTRALEKSKKNRLPTALGNPANTARDSRFPTAPPAAGSLTKPNRSPAKKAGHFANNSELLL
jgi:hypothetical protein